MLNFLSIRNIVLIEEIDIDFDKGLCVVTGETGAGKSIILDSLGLVLGNRANFSLRPDNNLDTTVSAIFSNIKNPDIKKIFLKQGIEPTNEIILKRILSVDGKSKSFLNDNLVSLNTLKNIGNKLVEIESQFSEHGLLDVSSHIKVLDEFGEYDVLVKSLNESWEILERNKKKVRELKDLKKRVSENKELFVFYLNELSKLNPCEHEYPELLRKKEKFMNAEKIKKSCSLVLENLFSENNNSIESLMIASIKELEKIIKFVGNDGEKVIKKFDDFLIYSQEIKTLIEDFHSNENSSNSNTDIESINDRIYEYVRLAKKHACNESELIYKKKKIELELEKIESESDDLDLIMKEKDRSEKKFINLAAQVSKKRIETAKKMDLQINSELPDLKLDNAKFKTDIKKSEYLKKDGFDVVNFLIKTNPKSELDHLSKISSGGELCRFALAIKVVSSRSQKNSIVFDEVDSGIGGSVASAVGEKLNRLGKTKQIIVVTHSPQVAALGDQHFKVSKTLIEGRNKTILKQLDKNEKILEIARMLSGKEITYEAEEAAKKLIKAI